MKKKYQFAFMVLATGEGVDPMDAWHNVEAKIQNCPIELPHFPTMHKELDQTTTKEE